MAMQYGMSEIEFKNVKEQVLKSKDNSRKCCVDEAILDVVKMINEQSDYVTTSSCSGRLIVIVKDEEERPHKGSCQWLYVTHESPKGERFIKSLKGCREGFLDVKFEPFILHVLCRTLEHAKVMQNIAIESGYRNTGIVLGKHGKITLAVRSTLNMEVPLPCLSELTVSENYLEFLVRMANEKMNMNMAQIDRFRVQLHKEFAQKPEIKPEVS